MKKKIILISFAGLILFIFFNNTNIFTYNKPAGKPLLLAHRGLGQTFDIENVNWNTNTASIIYKPEHNQLENTIESMQAAFDFGADVVEFDVRLTKDGELAVFHDYLLDYRTNGKGFVIDYTLTELQELDIGYGYTFDNGETFPFRNKALGLMPSFDKVVAEFPEKKFLIHIKDSGKPIGYVLLKKLQQMDEKERENYSIYGNDEALELITNVYPEMKSFTRKTLQKGLLHYMMIGWTGYIPESIRNMGVHIPLKYARFLWGWPMKFIDRMESVNSRVVLVMMKGDWSGGFDTKEDLELIPQRYDAYIITDRIDVTGPAIHGISIKGELQ